MRIGSVVAPGPVVKLATTRSSSDKVKASIQPEASAGAMSGNVTVKKVFTGGQPRFIAASSSVVSNVSSRDCTTTVTKQVIKVVCAMAMVQKPRSMSIATNNNNRASPMMTSGMTSGAKIIPENSTRPRKRSKRTSAMAASVPSTVAALADKKAMRSVTQADSSMARSSMSSAYQRVDQPPHTVTRREALNE